MAFCTQAPGGHFNPGKTMLSTSVVTDLQQFFSFHSSFKNKKPPAFQRGRRLLPRCHPFWPVFALKPAISFQVLVRILLSSGGIPWDMITLPLRQSLLSHTGKDFSVCGSRAHSHLSSGTGSHLTRFSEPHQRSTIPAHSLLIFNCAKDFNLQKSGCQQVLAVFL
jgi:hypothetical protein